MNLSYKTVLQMREKTNFKSESVFAFIFQHTFLAHLPCISESLFSWFALAVTIQEKPDPAEIMYLLKGMYKMFTPYSTTCRS